MPGLLLDRHFSYRRCCMNVIFKKKSWKKGLFLLILFTICLNFQGHANAKSVNFKIIRTDGSIIETFSISADSAAFNNILNKDEKIKIYTIPANKMLIIEIENYYGSTIDIFNSNGQLILNKELKNKKTMIALSNFSDGIYFVKVKSGELSKIEKIIIY